MDIFAGTKSFRVEQEADVQNDVSIEQYSENEKLLSDGSSDENGSFIDDEGTGNKACESFVGVLAKEDTFNESEKYSTVYHNSKFDPE